MTIPSILKTTLDEVKAAEYIQMSRSWLRQSRCLKFKHAPPYLQLESRIRYRIEDLDAWKAEWATSRDRYRKQKRFAGGANV
jgi:hypothetical protein